MPSTLIKLAVDDTLAKTTEDWEGDGSGRGKVALDVSSIMQPTAKAAIFNTALDAAEAAWLGTAITPTNSPSYLRLYVCVSITGIFRVARTVSGATVVEDLNSGTALVANAAYMFTVEWITGDSLDFRYSTTGGTILTFRADEIGASE